MYDDYDVEHLLSYNIWLEDANGNAIPMPLGDTVELYFQVLDFLDQGELEAILVQQFDDREFEEKPVERDSTSWILINTDHFSPYALTDLLSAEKMAAVASTSGPKKKSAPAIPSRNSFLFIPYRYLQRMRILHFVYSQTT